MDLITPLVHLQDLAPSPAHPRIFLDVAGFFGFFFGGGLVLTQHVLHFEPHVGR